MLTAHVGSASRDEVWSTWTGDPLVIAGLVLFAVAYGMGVRAAGDRPAIAGMVRRRAAAATAAVLTLVVALVSPLDAAAASLFSVHMVQHLLLAVVAAPLLVLAAPVHTVQRALPPAGRRAVGRIPRWTAGRAGKKVAVSLGTLAVVGTVSVWHAPALYDAALRNAYVHALEHGSILGASALFWWSVVRAARRWQTLAGVAALALVSAHGAALGALLALAPRPWYAGHAESATSWNVDALADQQVAGAIMWVPTAAVYLGAMASVLHRALVREQRDGAADASRSRPRLDTPV